MLSGHSPKDVDKAYQTFVSTIIDKINGILYFGDNELINLGGTYVIRKIGTRVDIVSPNIKFIDREYIKDISSRAMRDIEKDEFDSAITKARTLLEEVFCYVIEKKG